MSEIKTKKIGKPRKSALGYIAYSQTDFRNSIKTNLRGEWIVIGIPAR